MIFIVDYYNPKADKVLALSVEANDIESAKDIARKELRQIGIPKRNIRNIEEFNI